MDLIQRAAQRLKKDSDLGLVEKAAAKLATAAPQLAGGTMPPVAAAPPALAPVVAAAPPAPSSPPRRKKKPSIARAPKTVRREDRAAAAPAKDQAAPRIAEPLVAEPQLAPPEEPAIAEGLGTRTTRHLNLDLGKLQIAGFVTPTGSRTRISEEFRVIKRPLLLKAFATGEDQIEFGNLMMVTSAKPGEGKTFTAINLAMSIASERDLHVLLVDADVQRPSVFQVLGLPPQKGLLDVLSDSTLTPADVLIRTNIRNLSLMAAGTPSLATTELLASQKMATLMQDIATRYPDRFIILDAPPVLASSEPSVLALHVGQIVLVVESGKTGRRAIEQTLTHVSACPNVNIIFNKAEPTSGKDEFGGYGYGYYETNE